MAYRRWVALVALLLIVSFARPVRAAAGTVHLKNGGWIDGELMEVVPDQHVLVRLSDGTVRDVPWAEVDRVERETDTSPAHAPEPAMGAPQTSPSLSAVVVTREPDEAMPATIGPTLAILGVAGFGGGVHSSVTTSDNGVQGADAADGDLAPTYGGAIHFNAPLHPYVSIGGLARMLSFRTESGTQRSFMLDGAVVPRVQYVFNAGGTRGAVFFQVPVGLGWVHVPKPDALSTSYAVSWTTSPAFVFGVGGGLQMLLAKHIGLTLDVGWLHHAFSYHIAGVVSGTTSSADFSFQINQVLLQGGLLFAF